MSRSWKKNAMIEDFCGNKNLAKKIVNKKIRKNKELSYADSKFKTMKFFPKMEDMNYQLMMK